MTQLPLETWDVHGVEGVGYVANALCAVEGCEIVVTSGERHHLWRRSFLNGDYWWVELPDGAIVGNIVFLCSDHHRQVTDNEATISYLDGVFVWFDQVVEQPLGWQPPFYCNQQDFQDRIYDSKTPGKKQAIHAGLCPSCGRPLPHPQPDRDHEAKKIRKSWSIAVPVSEQENGAEVLDTNLEHARELFGKAGLQYGSADTAKYHVLSTALALFITHADLILDAGSVD